jgi:hypothetical protein
LAWLTIVASASLAAPAQSITCEGADGPYRLPETVSCSQAVAPQNAARLFMETTLDANPSLTANGLAAILEEEASKTCIQIPDKGTLGMLHGVGRWGCENGYSYRNLCDGFYLRKETEADFGYAIVHDIVVSSSGWNVLAVDSDFRTLTRAATGDTRISVILSLKPSPQISAPDGYADSLRLQTAGQAKAIMREIIAYCTTYKDERCLALRALATQLTQPASPPVGAAPASLSVTVAADKHLAATVPLGLSTNQVLLMVVTGVVTDDRGQPVANAEVRVAGMSVSAPTAADGSYRVSLFGTGTTLVARRVNIIVERGAVDVALKAAGDGNPLVGIAADGTSRLVFSVTSHGIRPESVTVVPPALGSFERAASASPLVFDKEGNGTIIYAPPSILPDETLTTSLTIGTGAGARTVAAAPVSIDVRYADLDGMAQTTTVWIKVCRPPVLLVQSFLGGPASWTPFADFARARRLDCQTVGEGATWGLGNGSLADWAKELARSVSEAKASYGASGIKISAVDIIAHSSSGLVARSLLEGTAPRQDVRRLVLVGTPNHGIAWLDQEVGAVASRWLAAHPTAAAELREGSPFLRQLAAPGAGDRSVDYINVVGRRAPSLSASQQGSSTVQDDGIVSAASSHLDGVPEIRLDGVVHAPGLPIGGTGLTESPAVWLKLVDLVVGEVPHAELDALRIELRRGKLVGSSNDPQTAPWAPVSRFPVLLRNGMGLRTGDRGYAAIAIVQAGETWGTINLDAKTEVVLLASSPSLIRMEVVSGRARFRASGADAGDFEVVLDASPRGTLWYTAQPEIRTVAVKGDYVASREETSSVIALGGTVIAEYSKGTGFLPPRLVEAGTGVRIRANGAIEDETLPARGWWTSGVWREALPFLRFPTWVMILMLLGLAGAAFYHLRVRSRRDKEARQDP